jgi:hypothetical protein
VALGRARDRAKIPAGIKNTCKAAVSEQQKLAKVQLRARDEITESKEKNPAAGRNAGKESGVYA